MRRSVATVATALFATTLVACGGSDHGTSSGGMHHGTAEMEDRPVASGAREIPVAANKLTFTPKSIQMRAGVPVAILLTAKDIEHDFYVRGVGHVVHAAADSTANGGLTIKQPGSYSFWCTVSGHKQGGMVGTITVTA
jgi:uncharacterized cupredoxin-like copper-binding protein